VAEDWAERQLLDGQTLSLPSRSAQKLNLSALFCDITAYGGNSLPSFRENLSVLSSMVKKRKKTKSCYLYIELQIKVGAS
jgi:hypothetical protein